MSATVKLGTVTAALLAYVGCAVSTGPPEVDEVGSSSNLPTAGVRTDPEVSTTGARLLNSFGRSPRETICVSYDGDLDVLAIDEFECRTVQDPRGGKPAQMCASCVMKFRELRDGSLVLAAEYDAQCELFAGTYMMSRSVTPSACGTPPPNPITIQRRCELGDDGAKCLAGPPAIAKEYPSPY